MLLEDFQPTFGYAPSDNQILLMDFIEPTKVNTPSGEVVLAPVVKAYVEVQDAHLDIVIPPAQVKKRWGYEPDHDVTLRDLALHVYEFPGPRDFISLALKDREGVENIRPYTGADDVIFIKDDILPFGYVIEDFLTEAQFIVIRGQMEGEA